MRTAGMLFGMAGLLLSSTVCASTEVGLSGMFGFGGEEKGKADIAGWNLSGEADLDPTLGFGIWSDGDINRYLRIGGEARFLWWKLEPINQTDTDRQLMMHFGPTIRLVFPLMRSLELFGRFAPGFSVAIPEDSGSSGVEVEAAFGFNIAGFGGLALRLNEDVGLLVEAGFLYHKVYGEISSQLGDVDYNLSGAQFMLDAGLFF